MPSEQIFQRNEPVGPGMRSFIISAGVNKGQIENNKGIT